MDGQTKEDDPKPKHDSVKHMLCKANSHQTPSSALVFLHLCRSQGWQTLQKMRHKVLRGNILFAGELESSLGVLLVDFMRLYGRSLNVHDVGVSCAAGGYFFDKHSSSLLQYDRPHMMAVEDPADENNDLCRGSWNIVKVG